MASFSMRQHVFRLVTLPKIKSSIDSFLLKTKPCQQNYLLNASCNLTCGQIAYKENKSDDPFDSSIKDKEANKSPDEDISPDLISAVKDVANSLPGDKVMVQSDLLQKLLAHGKHIKKQKKYPTADIPSPPDMQEMFAGLKIYSEVDKKKDALKKWNERDKVYSLQYKHNLEGKLFSGPSLGIFSKKSVETPKPVDEDPPNLWKQVNEEHLNFVKLPLPSNSFEELINWTNEGKYWTFPIDNEAGWEKEKKTGFHEHVFLNDLIGDFPKKGPIRHFMELVITGLSKNPHLSVDQKKEHIDWFRDYFEKRKYITDEVIKS